MENAKDELAGLRRFLTVLEQPETLYRLAGVDIKDREIDVLKREIAHLEAVLRRTHA